MLPPLNTMQDRDTRERHALAMARIVDPNRWPKGGLELGGTGREGCRGACVLAVQCHLPGFVGVCADRSLPCCTHREQQTQHMCCHAAHLRMPTMPLSLTHPALASCAPSSAASHL